MEEEGGGRGGSSGSDCPAYPHTGPQCFSSHRGPVRPTAYPHNCPPRGSLHRRRVVHRLLDSAFASASASQKEF